MAQKGLRLVTQWYVEEPVERVWRIVTTINDWPKWWPGVSHIEILHPGGEGGIGALRNMRWRLGRKKLRFEMKTMAVDRLNLFQIEISGGVNGTGRWTFAPEKDGTLVSYDWIEPAPSWWWRPFRVARHKRMMREGFKGLMERLRRSRG
ncbi:MAG: SRPBCC family protein [Asticcacaulis sp.]